MKIEFSSQRREMFLFLTTNMAAMKSRANQQLFLQRLFLLAAILFCSVRCAKQNQEITFES